MAGKVTKSKSYQSTSQHYTAKSQAIFEDIDRNYSARH
jgi:hypothetical protein